MSKPRGDRPGPITTIIYYFFLIAGAVVSLFPFYWMVVIGTNPKGAASRFPPVLTPGDQFLINFGNALERTEFWRAFLNSVFISTLVMVSVLFFCSLAGYAFAKYEFKFKSVLFLMVLATLFVPTQLNILPTYVIMAKLQWVDSFRAVIVPSMVNAFGIFWMRQYISSAVHTELIEAGRIDGAGHLRIFWRIVLPLITPALATLGIFTFLNTWNDFLWPFIVLKDRSNYTIQIALQQLITIRDGLDYGMILSATFMATLPLIIVFLLLSRYFISGLTSGAVKS